MDRRSDTLGQRPGMAWDTGRDGRASSESVKGEHRMAYINMDDSQRETFRRTVKEVLILAAAMAVAFGAGLFITDLLARSAR